MRIAELDYAADTARRFGGLADRPWSALLDSSLKRYPGARFDIFAADPYTRITTRGPTTEVVSREGRRLFAEDPLEVLRRELGPRAPSTEDLPFAGGAIGYFSYDLGRRYERWPEIAEDDIGMPEMAVGVYDWAVVVDHLAERTWLVGQGRDPGTFERWDTLRDELAAGRARPGEPFRVLSAVRSNLDRDAYGRAYETIQAHIRAGDCYQVNLTQRFSARCSGSAFGAYERLRASNPAPFSAYLSYPFGQVLCSSPERFLELRDGRVRTQPIKGTRRRAGDPAADAALIDELRTSPKDRAENVMIVDLLRNDLGRSCLPGSVRATRLFDVESFANVHHLVSTVEGVPAPERHAVDVLRDCFPGGSISGAPKVSAIRIIETCEPHRRGVYCGAIGYVGFDGSMDTNVAIRTLVRSDDRIHAWAGGGIVADSDVDSEYQESLDKASGLLAVLSEARISEAS